MRQPEINGAMRKMSMLRPHSWIHHLATLFVVSWWTCCSVLSFSRTQNAANVQQNHHQLPPIQAPTEPSKRNATSIHLLSLNFSERPQMKQVWKWKDVVLGDGRDFFVPKPKTMTALNEFVVENVGMIQECSVLSNCARFELLLVVKNTKGESTSVPALTTEQAVSSCILAQVKSHSTLKQDLVVVPSIFSFDRPQAIDKSALLETGDTVDLLDWTHLEGVEAVCRHLCLIAAGMALRPNRPDRPVPFRPFSSRDAHVLLQLKRTSEIASSSPTAKSLLDSALSAGKAARNPKQVPALEALRKFGSGGSRYSTDPPAALTRTATKAALQLAIEPTVQQCVTNFQAREQSEAIVQLRRRAERVAETPDEIKWINKQLHEPTMKLRQGLHVNEQSIIVTLESQLQELRQSKSTR